MLHSHAKVFLNQKLVVTLENRDEEKRTASPIIVHHTKNSLHEHFVFYVTFMGYHCVYVKHIITFIKCFIEIYF